MPTYQPDDLLTREEAAKYLGFKLNYINGEAAAGIFVEPFRIVGRSQLYRRRDLDAWRNDRAKNGRPRPFYKKRMRG